MNRIKKKSFTLILLLFAILILPVGFFFGSMSNIQRVHAVEGDENAPAENGEIEIIEENNNENINVINVNNQVVNANVAGENAAQQEAQQAAANPQQPKKYEATTKLAMANYAVKAASALNDMIFDIISNDGATDYGKYAVNIVKGGVALAATACFGSPAAGAIADGALDMIFKWFHLGESSQSELEMLESRLNDQFDKISNEIDDVKRQIAELSTKLSEEIDKVLNKIDESFEAYYAKTQVTDFIYSTSGNFSYNVLKNYLYGFEKGNSLGDLATQLTSKASDAEIEKTYKNLYKNLMGTRSNGSSYLDMFTEYYIGSNIRQSIGHYYYDYLSSNQSYITENASRVSLEFASQVYHDYMMMINFVRTISAYQMSQIALENIDLTPEEIMNAKYYYGTNDDEFVTGHDIKNTLARLDDLQTGAYRQMFRDIEYIIGLGSSYLVEEQDGRFRYVTKNNTGANGFGNVLSGEKIYLNQLIVPYCNLFGLDSTLFRYEFYYNAIDGRHECVADTKQGFYSVLPHSDFIGKVIYNDPVYGDIVLYEINFRIDDESTYLGGKGTYDDPYVIGSTKQFKLMYNETKNDRCFILVKDLDFKNAKINPLYSDTNQYMGTFDGGGHTIKNVKIDVESKDTASFFGIIGSSGVVKYLELENISVYEYKTNDDAKKIVAGVVAAVNNGRIISCYVTGSSVEAGRTAVESNTEVINKAISLYVGGLVGENHGEISYCKIESTTVNGHAKRYYRTNEDSNNKNSVYGGGLVGLNIGSIKNCYTSSSVKIILNAESYMYAGLSTRYPYINVWAGGIAGYVTSLKNIKNVYSEVNSLTTKYDYKNESPVGGSASHHITAKSSAWIPDQNDNDLNAIKAANKDTYIIQKDKKKVEFSFSTEKCSDPEFAEYSKDLVYDGRDTYFVIDNLKVVLVTTDKDGVESKRNVDFSVVGVYGFDSENTSTTEHALRNISIKVYDTKNNAIYTIDTSYYAKKNKVYKLEIPNDYKRVFLQNEEVGLFDVLLANDLEGVYYNGAKTNVFADTTFELDTTTFGEKKGYIRYGDIVEELDFIIKCSADFDQEKVVITDYVLSDDESTVMVYGYKERSCSVCGDKVIEYIAKEFNTTIVGATESTCSVQGYTGDLCVLSNEILPEDLIFRKGEKTPFKPHNYNYEEANIDHYHDEHSHFCIDCGHAELHMYETSEINDKIVCSCVKCGYVTTLDINSREQIEKLPRVVVQNAYAVPATELIKVFVDLHANTGITAANFTVNYDPELTLVSYKLGNILNGRDAIDSFKVYDDHLNVSLAQSGTDYKSDGTILALTFKLPRVKIPSDSYDIKITNKDNKDKFTDQRGEKTDFVAYAGKIVVVSRLPGDVNDDEVLDLVDAVIISKYTVLDAHEREDFVARMQETNKWFDINYGDVNLDGSIDISDIVQILRYTTGGYETNLVSNIFHVVLNHNYQDSTGKNVEQDFFVKFDNGTGKFGDMSSLPELQREGFKFVGWFTEFNGQGTKVTNDTPVFYNTKQYRQMLYAHFVRNTITFDANGGEGEKPSLNNQSNFSLSNTYGVNEKYMTKQSRVTFNQNGIGSNTNVVLNHQFLGWALTPDGEVVFRENDVIDLNKSGYDGIGKMTLYAVWSKEPLGENIPVVDGYTFLGWSASNDIEWSGEATEEHVFYVTKDITFYAQWRKNVFSIIYMGNGGTISNSETSYKEMVTRSVTSYSTPLWTNGFTRQGFSFTGWALSPDTSVDNVMFVDGQTPTLDQTNKLFNYVDEDGDVCLYAIWQGNAYTIVFHKNSDEATGEMGDYDTHCGDMFNLPACAFTGAVHKHFAGWALYPNAVAVYADMQEVSDLTTTQNATIHLYAVWEYDEYNVHYLMSGYEIVADKVKYNSLYTFRSDFYDIMPHYAITSYKSCSYGTSTQPKSQITWTLTNDIYVEVEIIYYNEEDRLFHYTINADGTTCSLAMYRNISGNKVVLVPHHIAESEDGDVYSVTVIVNKAFYAKTHGQDVEVFVLPDTVVSIGKYAFMLVNAKAIYMTDSVTTIGAEAFNSISTLETLVLSKNVTTLVQNTFMGTSISNLFFTGSSNEMTTVTRELTGKCGKIYYYSESSAPNCWHYHNGAISIW